ncbi:MAG: hypothetical protein KQA40_01945 [Candidatus Aenigmarchaeota archaeon]|nr:hypothetical protein [Candidatus Aenigmarchaeota archaeon]
MKKILILFIIIVIFIGGCVNNSEDRFHKYLDNNKLTFRSDLKEAEKIPIFINETSCKYFLYPEIQYTYINIAFIPNETENSFYAVTGSEIGKYVIIYRYFYNFTPEIKVVQVNSSKEAANLVDSENIVILLLGPSQTNRTGVSFYNNFVIIEGKDLSETNRTWTDLDLAFDKFLLCVLEEANKYIKK